MKVAIADDDPIVCSSLLTILTTTQTAEVIWTASDGLSVLNSYKTPDGRPDILLIDIQMPGMDGLEAAGRIMEADPNARILFLTTFADEEYISRALGLGAKGYLIKQDVASVVPALEAVMAGQVVLGSEALANLPLGGQPSTASTPGREPDHRGWKPSAPNQESRKEAGNPIPGRFAGLSRRERELVALVADGLDNHTIADRLYLSEGTVRNRISSILAKTNLSNRTQLAIEWLSSREA